MNIDLYAYNQIRSGGAGFIQMTRGLIAVWGKEAAQFLDGMITNDVKTLADGQRMLAAFPNAQGRLLALVRILRDGDRFLIETEKATREKVFQNLVRFTFAGDFFVEDLSDRFRYFELFGPQKDVYNPNVAEKFKEAFAYMLPHGAGYFVPDELADKFREFLTDENSCMEIDDELYETLRVESGIPKFGVDMDEMTIVPELGLDGLVSYNKGCYIGQEIIARIHFRGHVAKRLTGLILSVPPEVAGGLASVSEVTSPDGKNAGRITSVTYSPKLKKQVCLAFVRYAFLDAGTILRAGDLNVEVARLPFV